MSYRTVKRCVCALAIAVSCFQPLSAQVVDQAPAAAARPGFPPVEKFFSPPKYSSFSISPDGKLFAAIVPALGRQNIALVDLEKGTGKLLSSFTTEDVYSYRWIGDTTLEVRTANIEDAGGIRIRQIVMIDTGGRLVRDLMTMGNRGAAAIISTLDRNGDDLIVTSRERNAASLDAYRYNPRSNRMQLLTLESPGDVVGFVADRAGQVRAAVSASKDGKRRIFSYRRGNDDQWKTLRDEPTEAVSLVPLAFGFDNKTMYVLATETSNGDRRAIYAFDPETNQLGDKIYENKSIDAGGLIFDEVRKVPIGIRDDSRGFVTWIDADWKRLQDSIDAALPDTRNALTWARYDSSRIIVRTESETQPPMYFLLDRTTHKLEEVAAAFPSLDEKELSPRRFVRYPARDGLSIPAHLTMPKRPDGAKPPLIVDIHGGPFVQASGFGYSPVAQFLASRGYAVLQPDFRGTIGYGRAFEQAGWKQWGLAMQDDVTDGVRWLIDSGKVDPDRVCLLGGSYGGYATLWGLQKEPDLFRCGVAYVAVSDLELLFDVNWSDTNRGDFDNSSKNFYIRTIGDPDKDRVKLREVSPLYHVDRIQAPLMLAYGAADVRVPLIHGNRMRSALERNNKPYEWVVYNDEGHGFNKMENKVDFYRRIDAFLAKNLAPRTSPQADAAVRRGEAAR